jgi:hypothetical protein
MKPEVMLKNLTCPESPRTTPAKSRNGNERWNGATPEAIVPVIGPARDVILRKLRFTQFLVTYK